MAYPLNNVTTADAYTAANTLRCPSTVRFNIQVRGAAILYQLTVPDSSMPEDSWGWGAEEYANRTLQSLRRRTSAIRVRSAVAGTPATVTITAMTPNDG